MMTVISNAVIGLSILCIISACSTTNKDTMYSVRMKTSSSQFRDCSLMLVTPANTKAEVFSEVTKTSNKSQIEICGFEVKINKLSDQKFRMSFKTKFVRSSLKSSIRSSLVGNLGQPIVLPEIESDSKDLKYTFIVKKME